MSFYTPKLDYFCVPNAPESVGFKTYEEWKKLADELLTVKKASHSLARIIRKYGRFRGIMVPWGNFAWRGDYNGISCWESKYGFFLPLYTFW